MNFDKFILSKKVRLIFFTIMLIVFVVLIIEANSDNSVPPIEWYKTEVNLRGTRSVNIPGTQIGDINGYPRDRRPDAGCHEYHADNCNQDLQERIFPYINNIDPNENFPGDMNWDGIVDFDDYWILGSWWVNFDPDLDPNIIIPYPQSGNKPPLIL